MLTLPIEVLYRLKPQLHRFCIVIAAFNIIGRATPLTKSFVFNQFKILLPDLWK